MCIKGIAHKMADKCYTLASMEEEDMAAAGEANTAKADKSKSATLTNGKQTYSVCS